MEKFDFGLGRLKHDSNSARGLLISITTNRLVRMQTDDRDKGVVGIIARIFPFLSLAGSGSLKGVGVKRHYKLDAFNYGDTCATHILTRSRKRRCDQRESHALITPS